MIGRIFLATTHTSKALQAGVRRGGRALHKHTRPSNQHTPLRHQICPRQSPPHPCLSVQSPYIVDRIRPQNALDRSPFLADRDPHCITTPHHTCNPIHTARNYFICLFPCLALIALLILPKSHLPLRISCDWVLFWICFCLRGFVLVLFLP